MGLWKGWGTSGAFGWAAVLIPVLSSLQSPRETSCLPFHMSLSFPFPRQGMGA